MNDHPSPAKVGLTDAELAAHPTVFAYDVLKDQVVIVSGGAGGIVNTVVVTTHGLYGIAHTIAARSGVIGLTRAVAVEWAPLNIRVNCVAPGAIETEGWNVYTPQARAAYPRSNPMMRAGSPWDIAEACVYLAGPSGGFVTGETLTVDGGGQLWGETWTTGKPDYFGGEG